MNMKNDNQLQKFNKDIILIIRDKKTNRCREFHTSQEMTLHQLSEILTSGKQSEILQKYEKIHTGENYLMYEKNKAQTEMTSESNE